MHHFRKILARVSACAMLLPLTGCGMFTEINAGNDLGVQTGDRASVISGTNTAGDGSGTAVSTLPTSSTTTTTTTTAAPKKPDISVHMLAVGDNLVQTGVYNAAHAWSADGTYDFTKTYEHIKPLVEAADVAVINQETLICGSDYAISGSNLNFNSPVQLGQAMIDVGFDVFTMANNHMLDKRIDGLESCMSYWDEKMQKNPDILAVGAYRDAEDQSRIRVQEVKGMKIAYLAYTEHLNGYKIPATSQVKVGMTTDEALIQKQIKEAKGMADAVIVAMHWGNEDTHAVREDVKALAQKVVEWGADVILGTHPHTAQTMGWIDRKDGTRGFVYYSLGNFISAQTDNFNMIGEMGEFNLVKNGETGKVTVEDVTCMPCITQYESAKFANCRVYPYYEYTKELASKHSLPVAPMGTAKTFSMDVVNNIVNKNIPAEFRKLTKDGKPDQAAATTAATTTTTKATTTTTTTTTSWMATSTTTSSAGALTSTTTLPGMTTLTTTSTTAKKAVTTTTTTAKKKVTTTTTTTTAKKKWGAA
ncbi:MAG: CapA family protein [Oscillospiraceae bacterium]|nr:CapA family protein [Oscillospiraceae bacterium]